MKHLGQTSALPASPEEAVLDYVPNPGMIAEAAQEQLQRLRLDDRLAGQIVDDEVCEVG
jgi:hypothetical protein